MTLGRDGTLIALGTVPLATRHGEFAVHRFHNGTTGAPALAVSRGTLAGDEPLRARVHSSCVTSEAFGACDCDCAEQLDAALGRIAGAERGVVFYLMQEGRGAGLVAKALDRMLVQASRNRLTTFEAYAALGLPDDQRTYGEVAAMSRLLGITAPLRLLSNNPDKVAALRAAGVRVDGTEALAIDGSAYNHHYLAAKALAGHTVAPAPDLDPATPPEPVAALTPEPLATAPRLVRMAAYLLPVRGSRPAWLRLHLYVDTTTGRERVVLTYGAGGDRVPVRLQRTTLLDRFPLRAPRFRASWDATVVRLVAEGGGVVCVAADDEDVRDVAGPLLAAHVGGRRAVPLVAADDDPADAALVATALVRAGVRSADAVAL